MDDEALVREGTIASVRRQNDSSFTLWDDIEHLLCRDVVNVQVWLREQEVYCDGGREVGVAETVGMQGTPFRVVSEKPHRLKESNKMPLIIDSSAVDRSLLYR